MQHPILKVHIPAEVADSDDAQNAAVNDQIVQFGLDLEPGAWFEVWYPDTTESDYDVLRVVDGVIENADVEVKVL